MSETNINTSTGIVPREADACAGSGSVRVVGSDSAMEGGLGGGDGRVVAARDGQAARRGTSESDSAAGREPGSPAEMVRSQWHASPPNASPGKLLGPTVVLTDRMESTELQDRIEKALLMGPEDPGVPGSLPGLLPGLLPGVSGPASAPTGHGGVYTGVVPVSSSIPASIPSIAAISPEDIHVLVVDDEMMSRTVVSTLLKRFKYTVTTAEDGAEAMELLKSAPPGTYHLVLTDVRMPQMNGIELLQYIRSEETLRSVPVVMMSSFDQGDVVCACEEGGAEEYLVKPVTQKEVANIWQHVLRKRGEATTVPQHDGVVEGLEGVDVPHQTNQNEEGERREQREQQQREQQRRREIEKDNRRLMRSLREQSTITGEFLKMMRDKRVREFEQLQEQVTMLQEDCEAVSCLSERDIAEGEDEGGGCDRVPEGPTRKRRSGGEPVDEESLDLSWLNTRGLDASYFAKIHRSTPQVSFSVDAVDATVARLGNIDGSNHDGNDDDGNKLDGNSLDGKSHEKDLREFATSLNAVSQRNKLIVESTIRSGNLANPQEMVCYSDFSVDDSHFATVSVSRSVKVFDHASIVESPDSLQFPVWQATTRFKLSSVSWNSYLRSHLITSDYGGAIQLWDVASGMKSELAQFVEHDKRVWSIDFSTLDPMQFASASDDATVRLWSLQQSNSSVSTIKLPANACSVSYNPSKATMLSVACANHACYVFDTRKTDRCVTMLGGATRAVSYVKWLGGGNERNGSNMVLGASTDNAIRRWDIGKAEDGICRPDEVYTGHLNERNFVGLSVDGDGYVATGSEDNAVVVYYHKFPFPVCRWEQHRGEQHGGEQHKGGGSRAFTSSVCWARGGRSLLVGNSEGCLSLLRLN